MNNTAADGKTDAGAGVFSLGVQTTENLENLFMILRTDTNAIVAHSYSPMVVAIFGRHMHMWRCIAVVRLLLRVVAAKPRDYAEPVR